MSGPWLNDSRRPRVLHLFANYKWTGPADPAIRCAQRQLRHGSDVRFALAGWTLPGAEHRMATELWRAQMPVITGLELRKHFHLRGLVRDVSTLLRRLERDPVDVLHCHLPADHLLGAWAVRRLPAARRPLLVRTLYDPMPPRLGWRRLVAFQATDGFVAPTTRCADRLIRRFRIADQRVLVQDPPIERERAAGGPDLRDRLGLTSDAFVVGITARIQRHRRFDLLWEVARRTVDARPETRFVLLGRGAPGDVEQLVREPVRRLGLDQAVVLPGYLHEPDYSAALRSLDAFLFLVPGSDGTCRAVREAMALGLPVVATDRGMLPDLLGPHPNLPQHGPAGLVCDETPDTLAAALIALVTDCDLHTRLGAAAAARAGGPMDPAIADQRLDVFYRTLAGDPAVPRTRA